MTSSELIERLRAINATAPFNRWAGFEIVSVAPGEAQLAIAAREDLTQYSGFLHAGVVGALVDTACGYAAASLGDNVIASTYQVFFYAPAVGERFLATGRVVKSGRRQIFAESQLFAVSKGEAKLVAGGSAIFVPDPI